MLRLSDTQTMLLATAANREDGRLLPPPASVKARGAALQRSLRVLHREGLVAAVAAAGDPAETPGNATLGDATARFVITAAGRAALGIAPVEASPDVTVSEIDPDVDPAAKPEEIASGGAAEATDAEGGGAPMDRVGGKLGQLLDAVGRREGASLEELSALLGWLPHTTRAALSRLRARGHAVTLRSTEGRKAYHLDAEA
ncbi:DUF3489 domain-containing protein [Amaricoccus solimangrovi]|nr:DUF3489 domain-containing protein [Amaricoccus solimangrovi]